ncbi:MAG: helix-turn-helix transcriptional regulator [Rhodocyclaceae bacterium]|nr:helix-turn-helix transcriptional regulator [Rhodocyclaceae bacterium]
MSKPQIIFADGKPAFAVIPYDEYLALTLNRERQPASEDNELVPFVLSDYIENPIRVARVEAGLTQQELAARLNVTQGYVSKIEGRKFKVTPTLLQRVQRALDMGHHAAMGRSNG